MIVHLVLFRFKYGVEPDDARVAAVLAQMQQLPQQIPYIRAWEQGANITSDGEAWDVGLRALFASRDDLHAYFEHPAHVPVLAAWDEIAEIAFADFEI